MAGKLITLPIRVSLRSAQLLTRAAGCVFALPAHAIHAVTPDRSSRAAPERASESSPPASRTEPRKWRRQSARQPVPPADFVSPPSETVAETPAPSALPFEAPSHVSAEPELVRESAEPGAQDGAGADVTVREPWSGYRLLNARDVIDRTRTANVAELAAVRLYEARHRSRRTVLDAVDRQLKLANGGLPA
jgi:hypothetical protein